jgi:recombinational DNA repair ATPase RecF
LDAERRRAFWEAVGDGHQILATGTERPLDGDWKVFEVRDGTYHS